MSQPFLAPGWYPVASTQEVGQRPLRGVFNQTPLVIWRLAKGAAPDGAFGVLRDICPHRGAPLSGGLVASDRSLECPYHGWRFAADGRCVDIPAQAGEACAIRAHAFDVACSDGLIHVRYGKVGAFAPLHPLMSGPHTRAQMQAILRTSMADLAENILDTTHTSILHRGFLRTPTRRLVHAQRIAGGRQIEVHYPPVAAPDGVIGFVAGKARYHICDRFVAPAITQTEYRHEGKLVFAIRFQMSPAQSGHVRVFGQLAVAGGWLAHLQCAALRIALGHVIGQDQRMLEAVSDNRAQVDGFAPAMARCDVLRSGIDALLAGQTLPDVRDEIALWV